MFTFEDSREHFRVLLMDAELIMPCIMARSAWLNISEPSSTPTNTNYIS